MCRAIASSRSIVPPAYFAKMIATRGVARKFPEGAPSPRALSFLVESELGSSFLSEHDLFRKPVPTFRDHALSHAGDADQRVADEPEHDQRGSARRGDAQARLRDLAHDDAEPECRHRDR